MRCYICDHDDHKSSNRVRRDKRTRRWLCQSCESSINSTIKSYIGEEEFEENIEEYKSLAVSMRDEQ